MSLIEFRSSSRCSWNYQVLSSHNLFTWITKKVNKSYLLIWAGNELSCCLFFFLSSCRRTIQYPSHLSHWETESKSMDKKIQGTAQCLSWIHCCLWQAHESGQYKQSNQVVQLLFSILITCQSFIVYWFFLLLVWTYMCTCIHLHVDTDSYSFERIFIVRCPRT